MSLLRTALSASALLVAAAAHAGPVAATTGNLLWYVGGSNAQGQQHLNQGYTVDHNATFTRTLSGLAHGGVGGATLKLTFMGELDNSNEHLDSIRIDGYSLGALFNGNPNDDLFDNAAWGDMAYTLSSQTWGNSSAFYSTNAITATAYLSESLIKPLLVDGMLNISFSFAPDSNNYYGNTSFIRFDLETQAATVPEPAMPALLAGAMLAAGLVRRRSKKA